MALQLSIPNAVPLPCQPVLAKCIALAGKLGEDGLPGLRQGEVINIINGTPDGSFLYGVVCGGPGGLREGWLPRDAVRLLGPADVAAIPDETRILLRDLVQRVTLVCVDDDWHELDEPSTLALRAGVVLQLSTIKENWAYGWSLENPKDRGWFPLAFVHCIPSSVSSLVKTEEQQLSINATGTLVELLKATPPPPPQQWSWEGELPPVVAESAKQVEREWQESFAQMEAEAAVARESGGADTTACAATDVTSKLLENENLPDDSYPLVVCKTLFMPPKNTGGALLQLQVGDLVRVTSGLDATMYHGFMEGRPTSRGWFPQRNVKLVYDPLSAQADNLPAQIGAPPLPLVPPNLQRRRGA